MSATIIIPSALNATAIPRLLHQTYPHADLPDALATNVLALKASNPGWEYRFYNDTAVERFIAEQYGDAMLAAFHRIDPAYGAARADLFRYLAIYRLGGVYLDIKSRFTRPIDEVLRGDDGFIVSYWSNAPGERYEGYGLHYPLSESPRGEIQQWHVISAPGHPFLLAVIEAVLAGIEAYRPWRSETGKLGVLKLTGPVAYTRAIVPLLSRYPCRIVPNEAALALDYSVVSGDAHVGLFRRHYTQNRTSVVRLQGVNRWLGAGYLAARDLKARLGRSTER